MQFDFAVFSIMVPYKYLIGSLHLEDGGSTALRNVGILRLEEMLIIFLVR